MCVLRGGAMAEARYRHKAGYDDGLKGMQHCTRMITAGSGLHKLVVRPDPGGRQWGSWASSYARVEFELNHLRLLCDAVAPTEKTKRIRQFVRSTPTPAGAQVSDFASLGVGRCAHAPCCAPGRCGLLQRGGGQC